MVPRDEILSWVAMWGRHIQNFGGRRVKKYRRITSR
jgi:hypothetical protein